MRLSRVLGDKQDFSAKKPLVEIVGYKRVLVENHFGIATYSTSEIQIKVLFGIICVTGSELCLMNISREQLVITGCIEAVKICRR